MKDSEIKVTDELRGDLRHFCAELQQTFFGKEVGLEVEHKVSERSWLL